MAVKSKLKMFSISRRYEVWSEIEIQATDIDQAVQILKDAKFDDFVECKGSLSDYTKLAGDGVYEHPT